MELIDSILHLLTFVSVLLPIYFGYGLFTGKVGKGVRYILFSGKIGKEISYIVFGIIIIAVYHFFEFLQIFGFNLIPAEGTLMNSLVTHGTIIISFAFISYGFYKLRKAYELYKIE